LPRKGDWKRDFRKLFPGAKFEEPLKRHTTFRIGGPADAFLSVECVEDLAKLYRFSRRRRVPLFLIGWGSNLLVRDGGVRGIVFKLKGDFDRIQFLGGGRVRAGAAVRLPNLVLRCAERGLAGAESLVGVPGTVGGALVMNAGTRDGEIGDLVRSVDFFDLKTLKPGRLTRSRIRFRYRSSSLSRRFLLSTELELKAGSKVDIIGRVKKYQQIRLKTQPVHSFNVGSIFKNPPGRFVAQLIQEAGLKGRKHGGARVSPKHANFIENDRRATAADVLELVEIVRGAIRERAGVELELEMKVVGEPAQAPAR
jgi:UDP-N-acetylmuramate dehydrogenase